jgi:hypothetical protein
MVRRTDGRVNIDYIHFFQMHIISAPWLLLGQSKTWIYDQGCGGVGNAAWESVFTYWKEAKPSP